MSFAKRLFSVRDSPFSCKDLNLCLFLFICGCVFFFAAPFVSAKEKADLVVTNGSVITMDPARRVIENGAVAMRGDSILAVDSSETISARYDARKIIDARGALVLPGLINAHAHAAMSLFRGLADDLSFDDWLHKCIFPAEARAVTEEFVM
jgi:5-methylthioadenosine/S-adenosylhomocysteine deaminase